MRTAGHRTGGGRGGFALGVMGIGIAISLAGCHAQSATQESNNTSLPANASAAGDTEWLRGKAAESGGDLTKLSAEDRSHLDKITHGNGAVVLKTMAHK